MKRRSPASTIPISLPSASQGMSGDSRGNTYDQPRSAWAIRKRSRQLDERGRSGIPCPSHLPFHTEEDENDAESGGTGADRQRSAGGTGSGGVSSFSASTGGAATAGTGSSAGSIGTS